LNLYFGMQAVFAKYISIAFDNHQVRGGWCCVVGGDAVAGSVGIIDVSPFEAGPGVGVVVVRGNQSEFGLVDHGGIAERVDGDSYHEVERFDLVGPDAVMVAAGEGPPQRYGADGDSADGRPVHPGWQQGNGVSWAARIQDHASSIRTRFPWLSHRSWLG
jgi:hypothetical protein